MIYGIGIDLVEIERIKKIVARKGDSFLQKIFSEQEIALCPIADDKKIEYLAGRFAAKEAVAKAFGTGIGRDLGWREIVILKNERGKPYVILAKPGYENEGFRIHLSISHTNSLAVAKAIIEQI